MYKYKTKDGSDIALIGFGVTTNGQISSETPIENPNLVLIEENESQGIVATEATQPNVVTEAAPVPTQTNEETN